MEPFFVQKFLVFFCRRLQCTRKNSSLKNHVTGRISQQNLWMILAKQWLSIWRNVYFLMIILRDLWHTTKEGVITYRKITILSSSFWMSFKLLPGITSLKLTKVKALLCCSASAILFPSPTVLHQHGRVGGSKVEQTTWYLNKWPAQVGHPHWICLR